MSQTARQFVQYHERVLATNPIAYWPLNEKVGTIAYDWVSGRVAGAQNGAHVGVTLLQSGIRDGFYSPFYDGANDYTNIYSATFAGVFNGAVGTVLIWARVDAVGRWTDGAGRRAVCLRVNANNYVQITKGAVNNRVYWDYVAGGVARGGPLDGVTTTDWMCWAETWNRPTDQFRMFYNGTQVGATQNGLGVWAGALSVTETVVGASSTVPTSPWVGTLAHCAVWSRVLSADEIADLYRARWS